jgi:hypothetical protein
MYILKSKVEMIRGNKLWVCIYLINGRSPSCWFLMYNKKPNSYWALTMSHVST